MRHTTQLLQLAVGHDLYPLTGTALNISCELDLEQGNYGRVMAMADLGLRITREAEDTYRYGWLISQRGMARMETGDLDGAVSDLRASLELAQGDSLAKGLEDVVRLAVWCVRSGRHETGAVLVGIRDTATPLISSADSVLVARSCTRDLAELPAVLGAGYDAAPLCTAAHLLAASPDGVLAAALRVLDEAGTRQPSRTHLRAGPPRRTAA